MTNPIMSRRLAAAAARAPISAARIALLTGTLLVLTAPAEAQVFDGVGTGVVCSLNGFLYVSGGNEDDCTGSFDQPTSLDLHVPTTFEAAVDFDNTTVQFQGGTQAFSGTTAFNSTVSFTGPSVTFQSDVDFDSLIETTGIDNSGFIVTDAILATGIGTANLSVVSQLSVTLGADIDMGGNVIHGVAAGVADTDAVNVAQLIAATSGITTDITALETASATHSTQIADLQTTTGTHSTQIAAVEAVNTTQSTQISAIESVNTTQATQITAIQALNTTQSNQISALQAAQNLVEDRIDTLFDLRGTDRRDMKQGVASAMAMASAPIPSEPGRVAYAVNGAAFRGEFAVGGSLTYRLPTEKPFAVNVGFSFAGNKNNGARVGLAGEF